MILHSKDVLPRLKKDMVRTLPLLRLLAEEETVVYASAPDAPWNEMIFAAGEGRTRELWVFSHDPALLREAARDSETGTLVKVYGDPAPFGDGGFVRPIDRRVLDSHGVFGIPVRHTLPPNVPDAAVTLLRKSSCPLPPGADWERLAICLRDKPAEDRIWLAMLGDRAVGYLWDMESVGNFREIGNIFVEPGERNRGIGALLVHRFLSEARRMGAVPYYGCALSEISLRLAIRCGFGEVLPPPVLFELE